jgi:hypothetical protein
MKSGAPLQGVLTRLELRYERVILFGYNLNVPLLWSYGKV